MTLFKHGLSLATLFLLINALFRTSANYDTCKTKGNNLICATGLSDATALTKFKRSVVVTALTRDQLTADGWTTEQNPYNKLATYFAKYVGQEMLSELGISPSNNKVVNWEHTVAVDSTHPYNTVNNAIIVDLAWSPDYKMKELIKKKKWDSSWSLPAIRQLSDVMWIEWAARASNPSKIKYFFQMNVVNLDTRAIIEEAIEIDAANDASAAEVFYWEFSMSTEIGQALLGTANGNA
ncbi:hypothetical protein N7490_000001 [Penicillium lividum]|nr:hypothetical protein N7490_000001 [Penicillium lividum]